MTLEKVKLYYNANKQTNKKNILLKNVEVLMKEGEERYRALVEAIIDPIFMLDINGRFLYVNSSGTNFFGKRACDIVGKKLADIFSKERARKILEHIQAVFRKKQGIVIGNNIFFGRGDPYDFLIILSPIFINGDVKAIGVIVHDIAELKTQEKNLREKNLKLEEQKKALENKNIALKEIIEQIEIEKNKMKKDVSVNVETILNPILEKLRCKTASSQYIDLLQYYLRKLTSPFGRMLTKETVNLTPREIEVCAMIKGGLTSKEVAKFLNISYQTIEMHRKDIRRKLGLANKPINLVSYLQKMEM